MILTERCFGVLMPVFSLPGGTLDSADDFIRFLADAGARIWQVLPVGPTHEDLSPYLALSANAGNPCLIGLAMLGERAGKSVNDLAEGYALTGERDRGSPAYAAFLDHHRSWLQDYALFSVLRHKNGDIPWFEWPTEQRSRLPDAIASAREQFSAEIDYVIWQQFVFFDQWATLRSKCFHEGISLFGDVPIYVSHDSADVWQHQHLFQLAEDGSAKVVAGVPPDYFSPTGQRWGNPLYDWSALAAEDYAWWIERLRLQKDLFDIVRIDHFRGFESYYEIDGDAETAENGQWRPGPGRGLLARIREALPDMWLVAEDLGTITAEVDSLRREFALPGIRVLHFGFDGMWDNPHGPGNLEELTVLYTGTHDNNTSVGWYQSVPDWQRQLIDREMARFSMPFPDSLIACAFESRALTVIIPIQDLLGLGPEARVNTPGTMGDNWRWHLSPDTDLARARDLLLDLKERYRR